MAGRNVQFDIIANDKASGTLDKVGGTAEKTGGRLAKLGGLAKLGATGLAGLTIGAGALGKTLFDTGINVEAMGNKAKVVFGDSFKAAEESAASLAAGLGMTKTEVLGLEAGFGDLLTPMGFTQSAAADTADRMAYLTAALSQWSNGTKSAADVGDILSDALTGEYDSLKSLGVQIDANRIKELLHAQGKDKLTGAALKQATAEVALDEIYEQSTNALNGYDQGTNKLALAKNKLSSQVKTLKENLAQKLLPVFVKVTSWVADKLPKALKWLGDKWNDLKSGLTLSKSDADSIGAPLEGLVNVGYRIRRGWDGLVKVVKAVWNAGKSLSGWFRDDFLPAVRPVVQKYMPQFKQGLDTIKSAFASSGKEGTDWKGIVHTIGQVVTTVAKVAIPVLAAAFQVVAVNVKSLVFAFREILWPALKFITKLTLDMFGAFINGAASAFGWIPGLGPKLKTAAANFNKFRDSVNASLDGIRDQTIVMRIVGKGNVGGSRSQKNAKQVQDIRSQRAVGGYVRPGGIAEINEVGPEYAYFPGGGTVMTAGQTARMMRGGGTQQVVVQQTIHVHGSVIDSRELLRITDQAKRRVAAGRTYVPAT